MSLHPHLSSSRYRADHISHRIENWRAHVYRSTNSGSKPLPTPFKHFPGHHNCPAWACAGVDLTYGERVHRFFKWAYWLYKDRDWSQRPKQELIHFVEQFLSHGLNNLPDSHNAMVLNVDDQDELRVCTDHGQAPSTIGVSESAGTTVILDGPADSNGVQQPAPQAGDAGPADAAGPIVSAAAGNNGPPVEHAASGNNAHEDDELDELVDEPISDEGGVDGEVGADDLIAAALDEDGDEADAQLVPARADRQDAQEPEPPASVHEGEARASEVAETLDCFSPDLGAPPPDPSGLPSHTNAAAAQSAALHARPSAAPAPSPSPSFEITAVHFATSSGHLLRSSSPPATTTAVPQPPTPSDFGPPLDGSAPPAGWSAAGATRSWLGRSNAALPPPYPSLPFPPSPSPLPTPSAPRDPPEFWDPFQLAALFSSDVSAFLPATVSTSMAAAARSPAISPTRALIGDAAAHSAPHRPSPTLAAPASSAQAPSLAFPPGSAHPSAACTFSAAPVRGASSGRGAFIGLPARAVASEALALPSATALPSVLRASSSAHTPTMAASASCPAASPRASAAAASSPPSTPRSSPSLAAAASAPPGPSPWLGTLPSAPRATVVALAAPPSWPRTSYSSREPAAIAAATRSWRRLLPSTRVLPSATASTPSRATMALPSATSTTVAGRASTSLAGPPPWAEAVSRVARTSHPTTAAAWMATIASSGPEPSRSSSATRQVVTLQDPAAFFSPRPGLPGPSRLRQTDPTSPPRSSTTSLLAGAQNLAAPRLTSVSSSPPPFRSISSSRARVIDGEPTYFGQLLSVSQPVAGLSRHSPPIKDPSVSQLSTHKKRKKPPGPGSILLPPRKRREFR